jgi:molecular chaperone GrpE
VRESIDPQECENVEQTNQNNEPEEETGLDIQIELESQKAKAEEYYTQLQRLKAEFDNFRKRTQREKEEFAKYASERVILSLLPVLDNFERAVDSTRTNKDFDSFSQGVAMILKQFYKVLEDEGLRVIDTAGREFDPNLHDALMKEESEQGDNMILDEIQKGYYLKDKVLRPSKVKVSG